MHRAYHALPDMNASDGTPTGALYGFINMLLKLVKQNPDYIVVAFDTHAPTFRHREYTEYKAGRRPTPNDLLVQFPILYSILHDMGIHTVALDGFEADDILGTFARIANEQGVTALLVTGDRDALQLINDNTHVMLTKKGISEIIEHTNETIFEKYGLTPERMVDLKGLMGDSSDNLPGISGVGEITALKLLHKYGTFEETLTRGACEEKGALKAKLETYADNARMSYELGKINTHVPLETSLDDCAFSSARLSGAIPIMASLQLKSLINRLPKNAASEAVINGLAVKPVHVKQQLINSVEELESLLPLFIEAPNIAFDMFGDEYMSIAISKDTQYNIPTGGTLLNPGPDMDDVFHTLKPVFESESKKTVYDAKRLMHVLAKRDITLSGLDMDLMIADYLLNAVNPAANISELIQSKLSIPYGGAASLLALSESMSHDLSSMGMMELYSDVERPLIYVLFDMERIGFAVDKNVLNELSAQFGETKLMLEQRIFEYAGEEFNLQSPKQLGVVLFEKLNLPPGKKTARGYSTNAEVLESLSDQHPIIPLVIEHRFLSKLKSTFLDGLLQQVNPQTGRVHTTFNQNVTMTGRISSTEPNLQNIPVRTPLGREIRRAFTASPGNILVDADYSQIELRVLAHMSQDETMLKTFNSAGDIHTQTAAEVFGVPAQNVTQEQRRAAKAVNFGIVYGISDFGLAKNLSISRKKASEYIKLYFDRYQGVNAYMHQSLEMAKDNGYAKTLLGRRRYLGELKSSNYNIRSFGERVARNMPIQGTAADIIKMAMISVHQALLKRGLRAKLVLQIHDELIIDTPADETEAVSCLLKDCMENVMRLLVPLSAEVNTGNTWYDTK